MALFTYNVIVLSVFVVAAAFAGIYYARYRERLFLYATILALCFFLDHFIIFAAEFIFNSFPVTGTVSSYITIPEMKISVLVARQIVYLLIARELFGLEYPRAVYGVFAVIFVLYWNLHTPTADTRADIVQLFLFYSVMQAYLLALLVACFLRARKPEYAHLKGLLRVTLALVLLVFAFDVAWALDLYNPFMAILGNAHESNTFETILHLLYSALIIKSVVERLDERSQPVQPQQTGFDEAIIGRVAADLRLTKREEEVFHLLLEDYTYQEICDKLVISMSTVKSHAHNIYDKAGCSRRSDLRRLVSNSGR